MAEAQIWSEMQSYFMVVVNEPNQGLREEAERQLSVMENHELYAPALLCGISTPGVNSHLRQLAAIRISHFVKDHWEADSESNKFVATDQVKQIIRQTLCQFIGEPDRKVRLALASALSLVTRNDFPETWPEAFDILLSKIQSENADDVDGGLNVFEEISKDIGDQHLQAIVPVLFPQLYTICSQRMQTLSSGTITTAIQVFLTITNFCVELERLDIINPYLNPWVVLLGTFLQSPDIHLKIKTVSCQTLAVMSEFIPSFVNENATAILQTVWTALTSIVPIYVQRVVNINDEDEDDDDDDKDDIETYLIKIVELMIFLVDKKTFRLVIAPKLGDFLYYIITAMSMTTHQQTTWINGASDYAACEHEQTTEYNVRIACCDLLEMLCQKKQKETVAVIVQSCFNCINEGEQGHAQGNVHWWKIIEASFLSIGFINQYMAPAGFNLKPVVSQIIGKYLQCQEPFLFGRCLWLLSKNIELLSPEEFELCLQATVSNLDSTKAAPVRVNALKSLYSLCQNGAAQNNAMRECVSVLFQNLVSLVNGAGPQLLVLMLKVIQVAVAIDENITLQHESVVIPLVLATWLQYNNDVDVNGGVQNVFMVLSQTACWEKLIERSTPTIASILKAPEHEVAPGMKESAVEMLGSLLKGCQGNRLPDALLQCFPILIELMSVMQDSSIVQAGCECLTLFLNNGSEQLTQLNGVEHIVNIVAAVLQRSHNMELFYVGPLVTKLFKKIELGPVTEPMLQACATKMNESQGWLSQQAMLSVFATLIVHHMQSTIEFLHRTPIEGYNNAFEMIMNKWCENHVQISGIYDKNATVIAMVNIFETYDASFDQINVKGEQIITPAEEGKIMTRSQRAKLPATYTSVTLRVKMFQILVEELIQRTVADPEEVWEDEEDDDAAYVDADNEALIRELNAYEDDEEAELDPDLKNDMIYTTDAKAYLTEFFLRFYQNQTELFTGLAGSSLKEDEKQCLRMFLLDNKK